MRSRAERGVTPNPNGRAESGGDGAATLTIGLPAETLEAIAQRAAELMLERLGVRAEETWGEYLSPKDARLALALSVDVAVLAAVHRGAP